MEVILVLTSMTYAMKAQGILSEAGIKSVLTRNTQTQKIRGCGYGLQIDADLKDMCTRLLGESGIKVAGVLEVKYR